jgi:uncharacterized membrane protein (DUF4010 family)
VSFDDLPFREFAIALLIGALIGVEREKKQETDELGRGIGGLRTFLLFAEAGAVAAWLSARLDTAWIFVGGGLFVTALVTAGYLAWVWTRRADVGLTTEIAAVVTYLLGGLATAGSAELAVALAIVTSAILAFKEPLHGVVERIGREDLYAGLKLLIASFIVLPVLPDRAVDPWGALNPYEMWLLVILISGLSLLGYAATRWLGSGRGIPITGLFGGLVSSTAVTLSFARRSSEERADAGIQSSLAAGILIAWLVMFVRVGVEVAVVHPPLLRMLSLPLGVLGLASAALAAFAYLRSDKAAAAASDVPLRNPFSLTSAMRFAAFFALVLLVVKLVETYAPGRGLYGVAALAGLTDVDAITLSMAQGARSGSVAAPTAVGAIVVAALSNTLVKLGFVLALGADALKRQLGVATAVIAGAAGAALILL